jgi:hypothetical protein
MNCQYLPELSFTACASHIFSIALHLFNTIELHAALVMLWINMTSSHKEFNYIWEIDSVFVFLPFCPFWSIFSHIYYSLFLKKFVLVKVNYQKNISTKITFTYKYIYVYVRVYVRVCVCWLQNKMVSYFVLLNTETMLIILNSRIHVMAYKFALLIIK